MRVFCFLFLFFLFFCVYPHVCLMICISIPTGVSFIQRSDSKVKVIRIDRYVCLCVYPSVYLHLFQHLHLHVYPYVHLINRSEIYPNIREQSQGHANRSRRISMCGYPRVHLIIYIDTNLYVCLMCVPYMYALYVCLLCVDIHMYI